MPFAVRDRLCEDMRTKHATDHHPSSECNRTNQSFVARLIFAPFSGGHGKISSTVLSRSCYAHLWPRVFAGLPTLRGNLIQRLYGLFESSKFGLVGVKEALKAFGKPLLQVLIDKDPKHWALTVFFSYGAFVSGEISTEQGIFANGGCERFLQHVGRFTHKLFASFVDFFVTSPSQGSLLLC